MQDLKYKDFQAKLMPTVEKERIIGVRTPLLRAFAKNLSKTGAVSVFLKSLPHKYYEEDNLHAFLIEEIKDYSECIRELNNFLPYVNNWATCDSMTPKVLKKNKEKLLAQIYIWLKSNKIYTVRFAIKCLMTHFLDDDFNEEYLETVSKIKSDEYYIKMMIAWYFATALAKQYESTVKYIENEKLEFWIHNKTIQKAIESFRIPDEKKSYLKTLRRKDDSNA